LSGKPALSLLLIGLTVNFSKNPFSSLGPLSQPIKTKQANEWYLIGITCPLKVLSNIPGKPNESRAKKGKTKNFPSAFFPAKHP
jgi:hypothetical protein